MSFLQITFLKLVLNLTFLFLTNARGTPLSGTEFFTQSMLIPPLSTVPDHMDEQRVGSEDDNLICPLANMIVGIGMNDQKRDRERELSNIPYLSEWVRIRV